MRDASSVTSPGTDLPPVVTLLSAEQRAFAALLGRLLADLWRETQQTACSTPSSPAPQS